MKKLLLILILSAFSYAGAFAQLPKPDHIIVVFLENHSQKTIIGSKYAPYLNSLVKDKMGALMSNSYAIGHPSQPNYLEFFSGSNQGITDDDLPKKFPFTSPNLGAELLRKGYTFSGYSEDMPDTGYNGKFAGAYARKHNPWVNWMNSDTNGIPAKYNLPLTAFPKDFNKLPAVSFVIPNENNDMHNGKDPETIIRSDKWMKAHLDKYVKWAKKHNSLLIITFDEDHYDQNNCIPTIFIGAIVKHGRYDQKINHYNVLRTIEDMYGLDHAGASANVKPVTGCWR